MRIDAYTHFFPAKYFQRLTDSKVPDIGKRVREVPAIHDLDIRRKVIGSFPDYRQIICVALPPIGTYTPSDKAEDVAKLANDGLKELCDKYPDQFAGFVAEVPLTAPDAGARESERAIVQFQCEGFHAGVFAVRVGCTHTGIFSVFIFSKNGTNSGRSRLTRRRM